MGVLASGKLVIKAPVGSRCCLLPTWLCDPSSALLHCHPLASSVCCPGRNVLGIRGSGAVYHSFVTCLVSSEDCIPCVRVWFPGRLCAAVAKIVSG